MDYLTVSLRIITIIPLLFFMTLIMGKRQVGELPVFDFIIAVTIGAVAGADIADPAIKHGPTALAIILLALMQVSVSFGIINKQSLCASVYLGAYHRDSKRSAFKKPPETHPVFH